MIALQDIPHALRLDAFDADLRAEDGGQIGDAAHEFSVNLVFLDHPDEAAVDLDDVDRDLLEDADGGEAGSEIIQRHQDAPGLQVDDYVFQQIQIQQPAPLRHFKAQMLRRVFQFVQDPQHHIHEIRFLDLRIGKIDVDDEFGVVGQDLLGREAGFADDPFAELREQRVRFQDRYELIRGNHAVLIVLPAQQGFRPDQLFRLRVDHRLIE